MFLYQRFEYDLYLFQLHFWFLFFDYLFPLDVSEGILLARLYTHGLQQRRFVLTHVAFQRETGIGFFEIIPGRAAGRAKAALGVFLPVNRIKVSPGTLGLSILAGTDRNVDISRLIDDHSNPSPRRIEAAVFRHRVK